MYSGRTKPECCCACGSSPPPDSRTAELLASLHADAGALDEWFLQSEDCKDPAFVESNIRELQGYITQMQVALKRFQYGRRMLVASRNRHYSMQAPINRLPPELLVAMFTLSLPPFRGQFDHTPVFISRVCSHWRTIALSTPWLWSTIRMREQSADLPWDNLSMSSVATLVNVMLPLSRSALLDISVDFVGYTRRKAVRICEAIVGESYRWKNVSLVLTDDISERMECMRRDGLPKMVYLHMERPRDQSRPKVGAFECAPLLRELALDGLDSSSLILPWRQIRKLDLSNLKGGECLSVLSLCPQVESCFIALLLGPASRARRVVLDDLTDLTVQGTKGHRVDMESFIRGIVAPRVEGLTLDNISAYRPAMDGFLTSSASRLRSLTLWHCNIREEDLLYCLRRMPILLSLEISCTVRLHDDFFTAFTLRRDDADLSEAVVPTLEDLTINFYAGLDFDQDVFIGMVESRLPKPSGGRLRSLRVNEVYVMSQRVKDLSSAWLEKGLEYLCI